MVRDGLELKFECLADNEIALSRVGVFSANAKQNVCLGAHRMRPGWVGCLGSTQAFNREISILPILASLKVDYTCSTTRSYSHTVLVVDLNFDAPIFMTRDTCKYQSMP